MSAESGSVDRELRGTGERPGAGRSRSEWRAVAPYLLGILVAGALFTGMVAFSIATGREVLATQALVHRAFDVLRAAEEVNAAALEAESRQRSFLLIGDESLWRESLERSARARTALERLATLTAENPEQQRRVQTLREVIGRRLARLGEVVELSRATDRATVVRTLGSESIRRLTAELREALDAVIVAESDLLAARHARQRDAVARARLAYVGGAATGFVAFGIFAALLRSHFAVQREVTAALAASEEQFRRIADGLPQLIFVTDAHGEVLLANERWREFTGLDPETVRRGDENLFVHPEDLQDTIEAWSAALQARRPYEREVRVRRRDGVYVWHLSRAVPFPDPSSGELHWLGSMTDIDERHRQEARVRESEMQVRNLHRSLEERAAELAETNRELEAFSYSVSHDLRAPLRHVDGYTALLEKRLAGVLDEKATHYMATIRGAVRDLGKLIDDLLAFSRLGRRPLETRRVALGDLVRQAAEAAARTEPERHIDWRLGELPDVEGDPVLLRVAFDNLLGNAVKYTRPREVATIAVEAVAALGGESTIRVADNGVGFDMRYASKLFGVFQRLHSEREFEGTGIGLATVQRIVHRLGGKIRAEGVPGAGATFYLTLSAAQRGDA